MVSVPVKLSLYLNLNRHRRLLATMFKQHSYIHIFRILADSCFLSKFNDSHLQIFFQDNISYCVKIKYTHFSVFVFVSVGKSG